MILWRDVGRASSDTGLLMDFDRLEDAIAALEAHQAGAVYRSEPAIEWFKESGIWNLVRQYP